MKIYFTVDSLSENLEQNCPFGEKVLADSAKSDMIRMVGSCSCRACHHCYGAGFDKSYGYDPNGWIIIPNNIKLINKCECSDEQMQQIRTKQFRVISRKNYVKCGKCYDDKDIKTRIKIWLWHSIGIKVDNLIRNVKYLRKII